MALLPMAKTVLASLFKKPATRDYPVKPRENPDIMRGHIEVDIGNCVFCGMCERKCPTGAITVTREEKKWEIRPYGCIQCNCCAEVCPKKCLHMRNVSSSVGVSKDLTDYARISDD